MAVQSEDLRQAVVQPKRRTMRFKGAIGHQDILILLDSGSVGTFITAEVAAHLSNQTIACAELGFHSASGGLMKSDKTVVPAGSYFLL